MRKATAAGVFTLAGGDRIPAEVLYRQEDSEKKKKKKKEKENGCQEAALLCVLTRTKSAGRGLFTEQLANKERHRRQVCLKRRYSIKTQQRSII